MHPFSIE